jgi:ribosomal protein L40E
MAHYHDVPCPFCGELITDGDDIVVCPDCGTPSHRSCYFVNGICFNHELHEKGFEWVSPKTEALAEEVSEGFVCLRCGRLNNPDNTYCNYCGDKLAKTDQSAASQKSVQDLREPVFLKVLSDDQQKSYSVDEIDGIPIKEWVVYIGQSFNYYLYHFISQNKSKKKTSFTLSAAFFPVLYFIYRRVWGAAAVALVSAFLLNIPFVVLNVLLPSGIDFGISVTVWQNAANLFSGLSLILNVLFGVFAVWLYRRKAVKHMNKLKLESETQDQYLQKLNKVSGPSKTGVLIFAGLVFGLAFISSVLISFFQLIV